MQCLKRICLSSRISEQYKMKCFQVIDLLVKLLQCALKEGDEEPHMIRIFKEAYDVLHAYMIGKSRKNALYFAKYIDFFQTQFTQKVTHSEGYLDTYFLISPLIIYLLEILTLSIHPQVSEVNSFLKNCRKGPLC